MNNFLKKQFSLAVPNLEAGHLLEIMMVSAVSSLLIIRAFLHLFGYPQLGGGDFHIAHMLWGGFLMIIALIIAISFLNKEARQSSAIIGGVGFGMFIDELGKFITRDNDYFYKPSIAIIYVIFIGIFLLVRFLGKKINISQTEYTINSLEAVKDAILHDMNESERKNALQYLQKSDIGHPVVKALSELLKTTAINIPSEADWYKNLKIYLRRYYKKIILWPYFAKALAGVAFFLSSLMLAKAVWDFQSLSGFGSLGQLFFSLISGLFSIAGMYLLTGGKRLSSFFMFKRAVLVSIFLTQFFSFLVSQLPAIFALGVSLLLLLGLEYLISQEKSFGSYSLEEQDEGNFL